MARTKKVMASGRYGVRYGKGIKQRVLDIEKSQRSKKICPKCMKGTLKREAAGIWSCRKCDFKVAGKAYSVE